MPNEGAPGATDTTEGTTQETQGAPAATAGEQGSKAADETKDEGQQGSDELAGLKANRDALLRELKDARSKLKTFEDQETQRNHKALEEKGEHEKVIADLRAENERLKQGNEQWQSHLEAERAEITSLAKKLKAADRDLLPDVESLSSVESIRKAKTLAQRLLGESTTKPEEKPPVKDAAPSVTAANGNPVKPMSELPFAERVRLERERMSGSGGGTSILGS